MLRLEGVSRALDVKITSVLLRLEDKLKREWAQVLLRVSLITRVSSGLVQIWGQEYKVLSHFDFNTKEKEQDRSPQKLGWRVDT